MEGGALLRRILLIVFLIAMVTAAALLLFTQTGRDILHDPHRFGGDARRWVAAHPYTAPLVYMIVVVGLGVVAVPVWWLQILAGYCFGEMMGICWSLIALTVTATTAASFSRYVLGDWFHNRVESHVARLKALDEKLGHNGFLVVCAVRLVHVIPAGPANLAFGLSRISLPDVMFGTLAGAIPTVMIFVTAGAKPAALKSWNFWAIFASINIVLCGIVGLRYIRPKWFDKIGVE
jgi:uncharacterized membrane protein YdjX (TVP38/TMEM64 family)